MNYLLLLSLLTAGLGAAASTPPGRPAAGPTRRALIIAVGSYPAGSGWWPVHAENDVPLVRDALRYQGFAAADIRVLPDAQATKAGIVAALTGLAARTQPGDVVVVHFSGHGQQVADDNGDEADGYDEALVPYDAQRQFEPGRYDGQRHLRDDQLGLLLGAIRQRAGRAGEVLAVIDACNSGTSTRGLALVRGTAQPLAPPGYHPVPRPETGAAFGAGEGDRGAAAAAAPLVAYFATSPNQLNTETTDPQQQLVGPLSLAFARALTAAPAPTYAGLFDRIRAEMAATAASQTPQMEGAGNGLVFQGRVVGLPTYYRTRVGPDKLTGQVEGGTLQGLYAGTELAFYPLDTDFKLGAKPLATGQLTHADLSRATVRLHQPLPGPVALVWGVVARRSFGPQVVRLRLGVSPGPLRDSVQAVVRRSPFVQLTDATPADLLLELSQPAGTVLLLNDQGQTLYHAAYPAAEPGPVAHAVRAAAVAAAQATYLRWLRVSTPAVAVSLHLVPVTARWDGAAWQPDQQLDPASKRTAAGNVLYRLGDFMQLEVTNRGTRPAYFTILDIQPDNKVSLLLPLDKEEAATYMLPAGETRRLSNLYRTAPPLGQEVLKVIASDEPLDLRPLVACPDQDRSRGLGSPLARLLTGAYPGDGQRSQGAPPTLAPEVVNVDGVVYTIAGPATE